MNAEQARKRAGELATEAHCRYCDRQHEWGLKCGKDISMMTDEIADALLAWGNERLEEAEQKINELRDSPMLMGEGAWEDGRISGVDSTARAIQELREIER